ncbi:MAG: tetratricopeptide repeat protein [Planctomycetota bacterium]
MKQPARAIAGLLLVAAGFVALPARADSEAALVEGLRLEQQERLEAAIDAYRQAAEEATNFNERATAQWRAALLQLRLSRRAEAAVLFDQIAAAPRPNPYAAAALESSARIRYELGDLAGAEDSFGRVRSEHAGSPQALRAAYWLALVCAEDNRAEECVAHADALLTTLGQARAGEDEDGLDEIAVDSADEALYANTLALMCRTLAGMGRWREIGATLAGHRTGIDNETAAELAYWGAEAAYRTGDFDEAAERFRRIEAELSSVADRVRSVVLLRLGQLAARRQQWTRALEYVEAVEADGFELSPELRYLRGRARAGRGEFPAARDAYRRVLSEPQAEGQPIAAMAQWMIGETFFHQRDFERARLELRRVIDEHDQPEWQARAALEIGKTHEMAGDWARASVVYDEAIERWPGSPVEEQLRGRVSHTRDRVARRK